MAYNENLKENTPITLPDKNPHPNEHYHSPCLCYHKYGGVHGGLLENGIRVIALIAKVPGHGMDNADNRPKTNPHVDIASADGKKTHPDNGKLPAHTLSESKSNSSDSLHK